MRARGDRRIHEATPGGPWQILIRLEALTTQGSQAPMTIASPSDGEVFLTYLEQLVVLACSPDRW